MSNERDESLVPVFMPKLGLLLADFERKKGEALREQEVIEATDNAVCIMLPKEVVDKSPQDFPDVNPKDPWVDWHRVRPQYMGTEVPAFVFSIPCKKPEVEKIKATLAEYKFEIEEAGRNSDFMRKYTNCISTFEPGATREEIDSIATHEVCISGFGPQFIADQALGYARDSLQLANSLFESGALAVYCDSDYQTHSRAVWKQLAERNQSDEKDKNVVALVEAFMQPRLKEDNDYLSCGLHLLGSPDLIIDATTLEQATGNSDNLEGQAQRLFRVLAHYLLTEGKARGFYNRNTFSASEDAPKFRLIWEACTYPHYSIVFNPFGRWRLHGSD
ncbi:MAG: hypothetical protein P4L53_17555 [Candidatus Obscuribacterales bacterium]|nr:hypothetical protein [Candidatus Obscuribacterales bacterium]